ncbi:MAG: serine--tRNA ligase, partial [Anaerolineae bacterium]|nr:serine--tRNA ligase [Anaerolineae bacterium]
MLDLKYIREHPKEVKEALIKRNEIAPIEEILELDERRRTLLADAQGLKHQRNTTSKEISRMKEKDQVLIEEMRRLGDEIKALDQEVKSIEEELNRLLLQLPNLPHPSVPVGKDESENIVVRQEGEPREFDFEPLPHWELGPTLGIIDFERGVKLSGTRFYILQGLGAKLQRALIAWMLDLHTQKHGYKEIYPPFLVKEETLWGAAQLPKFYDNLYHDVEDDIWLVPTAEVPLTNLHRDEILEPGTLPLNYVAYTPCFRREKMSAGRDVRGIKRVHQFDKVEMYKFTIPETSDSELEAMISDAEEICRQLGIPYRVKQLCTGDLGFAAALAYDLDMWAPGCGEWLEVSTLSNCRDFQARRANIRFRREPGAKPEFVHTINGSGLALPRTMIALLENYQEAD